MPCDLFDFVIDDDFLNHRLHLIIKIIVQTITCVALSGRKNDRHPQTENAPHLYHSANYPHLTLNYLLPFQGVDGVCRYPPRCGGLACVALSGRKNKRYH